jgi:dihydroxy-acid dehydratase
VTPEAYVGGPIALVEDGDIIEIDLYKNTLNLLVPEEILEKRGQGGIKAPERNVGGILKSYRNGVGGAEDGALWL